MLSFQSPWEKLYSKTPSVYALKSFGCACYHFLRPYNKNKLQPRSTPCIFLGYPPLSKGYICLDPTSNKIYIACHVLFNETLFPLATNPNLTNPHVPFSSSLSDWLSYLVPTSLTPSKSVDTPHFSSFLSDFDLVSSLLPSFLSTSSPLLVVPSPIDTPPSVSASSPFVLPVSVQPSLSSSKPAPLDLVPSSTNTHPMVTRSKHGIYKPKVMQVQCDYTEAEPPSFAIASKHPQWVAAMDAKFQSLLK